MLGAKWSWGIIVVLFVVLAGWVGPVASRQFMERNLVCRGVLLRRGDDGRLHAQAQCETELRRLDLDVMPLLTGAQRTQLSSIYDGMLTLVATNETIPTPTPTVTP